MENEQILKEKAEYWHDKYDVALHEQINLEQAAEKCSAELMSLKERFAEVVAENQLYKHQCFFGVAERAHAIALEYMKRKWKDKTIPVDNCTASISVYKAAYKYACEQLEKE